MIKACSLFQKIDTLLPDKTATTVAAALLAALMTACGSIPQHQGNSISGKKDTIASVASQASRNAYSSAKTGGGYYLDDGPDANPPADLHLVPDAVPKHEPLRAANMRPYVALGKQFKPMAELKPYKQQGVASWYGRRYHGKNTASGEVYDMYEMTAAHPTLPLPSYARVTNLDTGKSVVVRLNDRGPFLSDRLIDLSYTAAYKLGIVANGSGRVEVESILPDASAGTVMASSYSKPKTVFAAPADNTGSKPVYLQLGAFGSSDNAHTFLAQAHKKLPALKNTINISKNKGLYKIHVGPYPNQIVAKMDVDTIGQRLGIKPLIIND